MNRCVWVAIYAAAFGWCAALGSSVPLLFIGGPSLYDHAEHHVFPRIPYHALPQLQAALARDMPAPYPGTIAAYREILPMLARQAREPQAHVTRDLPATAASTRTPS